MGDLLVVCFNIALSYLTRYFFSAGLFTVDDVNIMTDEIMKMKHFVHPNVMTLIGVCVSVGGGPAIVMPFMENGSLLNYLRRDKKNITIKDDQDLETVRIFYRQSEKHSVARITLSCYSEYSPVSQ